MYKFKFLNSVLLLTLISTSSFALEINKTHNEKINTKLNKVKKSFNVVYEKIENKSINIYYPNIVLLNNIKIKPSIFNIKEDNLLSLSSY